MAIHVDVYATLHEREARRSADQLANFFDQAGARAGEKFGTRIERSLAVSSPKIQRALHGVKDATDRVAAADRKLFEEMQKTGRETERSAELSNRLAAARRKEADAHRAAGTAIRDTLRDMQQMDSAGENISASLKALGTSAHLAGRGMATIAAPAVLAFLYETAQVAVTASQSLLLLPAAATAAAAGMGTLKLATLGFSDAMKDIRDVEKFGEDLTKLSPNARSAALAIRSLLPEFDALQQATQNEFFEGFGAKIQQLSTTFLPGIRSLTTGIAQTMNEALTGVADTLMTPANQANIASVMNNIGTAFRNAAPAAEQFTQAFIDLTSVGSEFLPELGTGIADAATEFATFIREARQSGQLKEWMREGIDAVKELAGAIKDVGTFIYDTFGGSSKAEVEAWRNSINNALGVLGPLLQTLNTSMRLFNTNIGDSTLSLNKLMTPLQNIRDLVDSIRWFFDPNFRAQEGALGNATDKLNEARAAAGLPPVNAQGVPTGPAPRGPFGGGGPSGPGRPGLGNTALIPNRLGPPKGTTSNRPKPPGPGDVPFFSPELWQNISSEEFNRIHGVSPGLSAGPGGAQLPGAGPGSFVVDQQKVADAQTRLDAERSDIESHRLRLLELEAQGNASQRELLEAKRAITEDETALSKAQRELADAQQGTWKKLENQANAFASGMEQIGVAIDADFGLSQGLAGLAKNLVAFLGNLAAAPILGPLAAISAAQGGIGRTGSGLMGIAAAHGAFGPQYTPAGLAAADLAAGGGGGAVTTGLGGLASGLSLSGPSKLVDTGSNPSVPNAKNAAALLTQLFPGIISIGGSDNRPPGTPQMHTKGRALDIEVGQNQALGDQINQWLRDNAEALGLESTIWRNTWKDFAGNQATEPGHDTHIHGQFSTNPAADISALGPSQGNFSGFGTPGSPQATANMIYQQAVSRGYSQHEATSIVAYAIGESSLNPGSSGGAQGGGGAANEVIGLFQQKPAFAIGGGIDPSQRSDPVANTYAYLNQLEKNRGLPIEQALPATSSGGPLATGPGSAPQPWDPLMAQARTYLGFAKGGAVPAILHRGEHVLNRSDVSAMGGQRGVYNFRSALHYDQGGGVPPNPFLDQFQQALTGGKSPPGSSTPGQNPLSALLPGGPGAPGAPGPGAPGAPGAPHQGTGAPPGPSPIGGGEPKVVPGGGASGGGLFGAAAGAAALAANVMAPGSGAAVQIAAQEIQRAIKFGSEVAGIAAQGLLETFIPFGGSDLAANNWITRIGGAFAGSAPQIPNLAGTSHSADTMQQANAAPVALPPPISSGQGSGPAPGPAINVTYNNNGAPEDRAGADIASNLRGMYANMPRVTR